MPRKALLLFVLLLSLTACRRADSAVPPEDGQTAAPETEIVLAQQETPEIYAGKRIIEDDSRLDLAYRPTLENVIAHSAAVVRAAVDRVNYTAIAAQAWTVVHADVLEVLSGDVSAEPIDIYAYGGYISMQEIADADGDRERYADDEPENTIIHQAAGWQVSPLVGEQYIFFLGAPTDAMPADAYEQLGWRFCQMLVGEDETLYYTPYNADAPTAEGDVASMTLSELKALISA